MRVPRAKTAVPHVPPRHVSRPRLLAVLDAAEPGQLVVVVAPAGYGKTLLLAEWATTRRDRPAWVSLDDDDTTAQRFWSAVLAALRSCPAVPDDSAVHRVVVPGGPDPDAELLRDLVEALDALPERVTLVLDDVHELTAPEPARALAALVRERPRLQLVLSGRADPRIPIARIRLSGALCEIRARDLAFSTPEAGALLAAADVAVAPGQLRLLVDQTDGWGAGLRLAAVSLRTAPDADRFLADLVGNSKATSDYLVGEILSRLAPHVCDLLRAVSVCDQLTAGLAAALSGRPDAGEVLAALERDTSLVLSYGAGRAYYRVHPLLRSHLRADLGRRRPELIGRLHARAADWFAARDRAAPALLHARLAGDATRVRTLLEQHAVALVAGGELAAVRDAVGLLTAREADPGTFVTLVEALVAVETGAAGQAERHLRRADSRWPDEPDPALVALRALVRSRLAGMVGDAARMVRGAAELDAVGPRADPELVAMGRLDRAVTALMSGRPDSARRLAEEVLADARDHGRGYLAARALGTLATVAAAEGDYGRVAVLGDLADEELSRGHLRPTGGAFLVPVVRAYAALLDLRPVRCLDVLGQPRTAGSGFDALDPMSGALRAAALTDLGHGRAAAPELRATQAALGARPGPVPLLAMATLLVHGAALRLDLADVAADVARLTEETLGPTAEVVLMRARRAGSPGAAGSPHDRALAAALRSVVDGTTRAFVNWTRIEAGVLLCGLTLADGRHPQARQELDQALRAAAASRAVRPLLAAGRPVVDLIARQLGSFGPGDAVAARVLEHRGDAHTDDPVLTARERDVLALLATSGSLRDIAERLDVAPSTVKTHLRALYQKLGVTSRREAVAAGRRRGALGAGSPGGDTRHGDVPGARPTPAPG